jgi:predicted aspartyl protease
MLATALLEIGTAASAECEGTTIASTRGADGLPRVTARLLDRDFPFVLDTGAPVSAIRESVVEILQLPHRPIRLDAVSGVTGRPFQERVVVPHVQLGATVVDDVSFLIEPRSHASDDGPVGLIGADLFARFDLELDLAADRIRLLAPGSCRPPEMTAVPATILPSRHIVLDVVLDGQRLSGLLDTGATRSLLKLDAAHRLFGLDPGSPTVRQIGEILGADGGRMPAYGHPFAALGLGGTILDRPDILLFADQTQREHKPLATAEGNPVEAEAGLPDLVLGLPVLRRLHLIVAYRDRLLYVAPASPRRGPA